MSNHELVAPVILLFEKKEYIYMKDAIGNKIIEVVENILAKDAKDITYNEYCIIKNVYDQIKYEEEQDEKNKKFLESILNTLYCGFGTPPTPIQFKQNVEE